MRTIFRSFEAVIASAAFAIMVLVVIANVLARFTLGISLVFTEEVAYLCFAYSVFFGAAMLYKQNANIVVEVFVDALPDALRKNVMIIIMAMLIFANLYFSYLGFYLAFGSWTRKTAFLQIPYFYVNLAPAIGFALMSFYSVVFVGRLWRGEELVK